MQVNPYLTFNGNCREAMIFYHRCLGGELYFQTIGESPLSGKMPAKMKDCILHATLRKGGLTIMATDIVGEKGLLKGNSVSMLLCCSSEEEITTYFTRLSEGGKSTHPIEFTFWGALFGGLIDKYGNNWLLQFRKQ